MKVFNMKVFNGVKTSIRGSALRTIPIISKRKSLHKTVIKNKHSVLAVFSSIFFSFSTISHAQSIEVVLPSIASMDGIVTESPALNGNGGFNKSNQTGTSALVIGDFPDNRQVKTIVSFDTSSIPQDSTIDSATLRLRFGRAIGQNVFETLGPCLIDVNSGAFSGNSALESSDFNATATAMSAGTLTNVITPGEWSEAQLNSNGLNAIDTAGITQIRAYCVVDDNGDSSQDTATFSSGELAQFSPELVINYSEVNTPAEHSAARQWNEELLEAIRHDFARPTVHARNLFHTSAAMYDAWAAYDPEAGQVLHHEKMEPVEDVSAARFEAISYAAYRILSWRFSTSPGAETSLADFDEKMDELGFDKEFTSTEGDSPAALGNRIAFTVLEFGLTDGSNELGSFSNLYYEAVNPPLLPDLPGNPDLIDPNRWQPLSLEFFIDQSGNPIPGGASEFLSPEWGQVTPFALTEEDLTIYNRDGFDYWVYHDPGAPPALGTDDYREGFQQVVEWSGFLDPADGVMIDISPASNGNNPIGTNAGNGHDLNPVTGLPYEQEIVPAGDYYRVLAEFWADGPDSETPPGHWFGIANYVMDHDLFETRFNGVGELLDPLEFDVKAYLVLGGAMHDAAISAWGVKGWYDYIRPVSAIRHMCDLGQSSDPSGTNYNANGLALESGKYELVTSTTAAPGGIHEHLAGDNGENIGKIAVMAWRGPDYILDTENDTAGVGWILCENWWPYQRPTFVTPPFAGYVSGHSTFSRAAAEVMTLITGDEFFPGGMGTFEAPKDEFLVFEDGPSVDIVLQWATYADASDETSLSRIYGGIHPTADDIPGRFMGAEIGPDAFNHAVSIFSGELGILPTVTMVTSVDGEVFEPGELVELSATAFDSDGLDISEMIVWASSVDGELGTGSSISTDSLSDGVHVISATVTDSDGQMKVIYFEISIGSQAPTLTILAPSYDTRVDQGVDLFLSAQADDFEDGDISTAVVWSSDVDGEIGSGDTLVVSTLSPGEHTISASITDSESNETSASTFVTIYGQLTPSEATFTSTAEFDGFVIESNENTNQGGSVLSTFAGGGALRFGDFRNDSQIKLFTSFALDIPDGSVLSAATLNLKQGGVSGVDPTQVLGPCLIDIHTSGFSGNLALESSDFQATATVENAATFDATLDPENWSSTSLSEESLAAIESAENVQMRVACSLDDNDDNVEDSLAFYSGEDANADNHPQLVVLFSDPSGNTAPSVVISSPVDELRAEDGQSILFDALASDIQDGDLSSGITWRSSIDGIIGNGSTVNTDSLSTGSHIVTAEVLDSAGVPGRQTIIVHVGVNLTPEFTDVTDATGLNVIPDAVGLAAGDYDNDGCVDLAVSTRNQAAKLLKNNCDGTFSDVSIAAGVGVSGKTRNSAVVWGDYDNDGLLDLYIANDNQLTAGGELYHNLGDGTFEEVGASAGVNTATGATGATWNDYDGDNDLDLFVSVRYGTDPLSILYQNDGNGNFVDVAPSLGIHGAPSRPTFSAAWVDFDENLTQDLWVVVDFSPDEFYRNLGAGNMEDATAAAGLDDTAQHGMGIAVGDPNGDGCLDVLVTNNANSQMTSDAAESYLHANNCDGTFSRIGQAAGILNRDVTEWGASFVDFDNDGDEDLSIVAGGFATSPSQANVLYQNISDGTGELEFIEVTEAAGVASDGKSKGTIWFDFDEDGDMDWFIAHEDTGVQVFRNDGPVGNFIKVQLQGTTSNSYGVGARVEVVADGKTMVRYLRAGLSFASAEELEATFGLGDLTSAEQITVKWPSGTVDTLFGIGANSLLLIEEGQYP